MLSFFSAQALSYLILVCPGSMSYRLVLVTILLSLIIRNPFLSLLAVLWQGYSLSPSLLANGLEDWISYAPLVQLRCDQTFWFICSSSEPNLLTSYLFTTPLGSAASWLRDFVEGRCFAWDPIWGGLAFSMLMGGVVDGELKGLYRQLGFLHVLVISGSQFSILSRWLDFVIGRPSQIFYAMTLIDWRAYRHVKLFSDFVLGIALLVYLLACGATPPCQRAFLDHGGRIVTRWLRGPEASLNAPTVFALQALFFPQTWLSLSNVLSWGAILCLKYFGHTKSIADQFRASMAIQLLSLSLFGRISLSSLYLDFFIAPLWDILLFVSIAAILVPELGLQGLFSESLAYIHSGLAKIEQWQTLIFGGSLLALRHNLSFGGRVAAAFSLAFIFRRSLRVSRGLQRPY